MNVQWTIDLFFLHLWFLCTDYAWIQSGSNYICRMYYETPDPQQKQNPVHKISYNWEPFWIYWHRIKPKLIKWKNVFPKSTSLDTWIGLIECVRFVIIDSIRLENFSHVLSFSFHWMAELNAIGRNSTLFVLNFPLFARQTNWVEHTCQSRTYIFYLCSTLLCTTVLYNV